MVTKKNKTREPVGPRGPRGPAGQMGPQGPANADIVDKQGQRLCPLAWRPHWRSSPSTSKSTRSSTNLTCSCDVWPSSNSNLTNFEPSCVNFPRRRLLKREASTAGRLNRGQWASRATRLRERSIRVGRPSKGYFLERRLSKRRELHINQKGDGSVSVTSSALMKRGAGISQCLVGGAAKSTATRTPRSTSTEKPR